jgi:2Fe-2S ferredoxin
MVNVIFVQGDRQHVVKGGIGRSVMETAIAANVPGILADCGGALSCATCHIHIRPEWFERIGAPDAEEEAMLEMAIDPDDRSRLACQVILNAGLDGLTVDIPLRQF